MIGYVIACFIAGLVSVAELRSRYPVRLRTMARSFAVFAYVTVNVGAAAVAATLIYRGDFRAPLDAPALRGVIAGFAGLALLRLTFARFGRPSREIEWGPAQLSGRLLAQVNREVAAQMSDEIFVAMRDVSPEQAVRRFTSFISAEPDLPDTKKIVLIRHLQALADDSGADGSRRALAMGAAFADEFGTRQLWRVVRAIESSRYRTEG